MSILYTVSDGVRTELHVLEHIIVEKSEENDDFIRIWGSWGINDS